MLAGSGGISPFWSLDNIARSMSGLAFYESYNIHNLVIVELKFAMKYIVFNYDSQSVHGQEKGWTSGQHLYTVTQTAFDYFDKILYLYIDKTCLI